MLHVNDFGAKFDLSIGDEISFSPYPDLWYTVYQFNVFADANMVAVLNGTDVISKDLRNVVNHRVPVKTPPQTKPKRERGGRLKAALSQSAEHG